MEQAQQILAEDSGRLFSALECFGYHIFLQYLLSVGLEGTGVMGNRINNTGEKRSRETRNADAFDTGDDELNKLSYARRCDALGDMKFFDRTKPIVNKILCALVPDRMLVCF